MPVALGATIGWPLPRGVPSLGEITGVFSNQTLGIPDGTARSRLHYATRTLRGAIQADAAPVAHQGRMA